MFILMWQLKSTDTFYHLFFGERKK